jgi:sugar O-acyltransferase (sialic acid O-acetyltransferase NeuD family)
VEKIVLVGASGHARLIIDAVEKEQRWQILGLVDDDQAEGSECLGYAVMGTVGGLRAVMAAHGVRRGIIAIGDNGARAEVAGRIAGAAPEFGYVMVIHPAAEIARQVTVGEGSVILAGGVINAGARVGRHCYVSAKASLDHDSEMADFASLGPGATVGGNVRIGTGSAIALGANVIHGIRVGAHTVIGAGATVVRDIPERVVAYGVPARVVRARVPGEKYL